MTKRPKVQKHLLRLISDCESQLKYLEEALAASTTDPERYKQVAGYLRILVAETRTNKPLLLDLLDTVGLNYIVRSSDEYAFFGGLTTVDAFAEDKEFAAAHGEAESLPLREYINRGLAVYFRPTVFSYKDLILMVAHQIGGAHEDLEVDLELPGMEQVLIGGHYGHSAPLIKLTPTVLHAGRQLIEYATANLDYKPRYFIKGE